MVRSAHTEKVKPTLLAMLWLKDRGRSSSIGLRFKKMLTVFTRLNGYMIVILERTQSNESVIPLGGCARSSAVRCSGRAVNGEKCKKKSKGSSSGRQKKAEEGSRVLSGE